MKPNKQQTIALVTTLLGALGVNLDPSLPLWMAAIYALAPMLASFVDLRKIGRDGTWPHRLALIGASLLAAVPSVAAHANPWVWLTTLATTTVATFLGASKVRGDAVVVVGEQSDDGPVPSAADVAKDKATQQAAGAAAAEAQKHLHPGPQR